MGARDLEDLVKVYARISQIGSSFSPGAPIDEWDLFAGRSKQVTDVLNAINQRGVHVILYGERGVGKTSLANVLAQFLRQVQHKDVTLVKVNCDGTDNFPKLWRKVFREISVQVAERKAGFREQQSVESIRLDQTVEEDLTPDDVRYTLQGLGTQTIIVMDEIDRIGTKKTTTLLADTIKGLSDHSVPSTVMMVGVADSVDELIAEHRSIERSLVQTPMPRMSRDELFEILDKGLQKVEMSIEPNAKVHIARLSQGLPHYTHLLGLHSAQNAAFRASDRVEMVDVENAINRAVEKTNQSIISAYHKATVSPQRDNLYCQVLLACALAETDDLGYFAAVDVRAPLTTIMGKPYEIPAFSRHLNEFCEDKRGQILHKTGTARRFRFRFKNPLMQPFTIMHGLADGVLSLETLRRVMFPEDGRFDEQTD